MFILGDEEQDIFLKSPSINKKSLLKNNSDSYKIGSPVGTWSVQKDTTSQKNSVIKRKLFDDGTYYNLSI